MESKQIKMEVKCNHTDWEACVKCINHYEGNTENPINGTQIPHKIVKTELICRKPWCRKKITGGQELFDRHVNLCKKPRMKKSTVCPQCDKQFSKVSNLNRHVATVHSVLRKFVCKNCNKSYSDVDKLDNHLQRCTFNIMNTLPSKLPVLDGRFSKCNDVTSFLPNIKPKIENDIPVIITGNNKNIPPFVNINGAPYIVKVEENGDIPMQNHKSFVESNRLNKVIGLLKTEQQINAASNRFKVKKLINGNLRVMKKRKSKSTVCLHCNKQFSRVSNLNRHVRIVHRVKKFCCKECNKSYAVAGKLQEHFLLMHSHHQQAPSKKSSRDEFIINRNSMTVIDNSLANKKTGESYDTKHKLMVEIRESNDAKNEFKAEITTLDDIQNKFMVRNNVFDDENKVFVIDDVTLTEEDFSNNEEHCKNSDSSYDYSMIKREDNYNNEIKKENNSHEIDNHIENYISTVEHINGHNIKTESIYNEVVDMSNKMSVAKILPSINGEQKSKTVTCPHCQKQFSKRSNLNRHIVAVHDIKFTCENCSKSFVQAEKLENHILLSSCKPGDTSYRLLKADTALPCMVIEEVFH